MFSFKYIISDLILKIILQNPLLLLPAYQILEMLCSAALASVILDLSPLAKKGIHPNSQSERILHNFSYTKNFKDKFPFKNLYVMQQNE